MHMSMVRADARAKAKSMAMKAVLGRAGARASVREFLVQRIQRQLLSHNVTV